MLNFYLRDLSLDLWMWNQYVSSMTDDVSDSWNTMINEWGFMITYRECFRIIWFHLSVLMVSTTLSPFNRTLRTFNLLLHKLWTFNQVQEQRDILWAKNSTTFWISIPVGYTWGRFSFRVSNLLTDLHSINSSTIFSL